MMIPVPVQKRDKLPWRAAAGLLGRAAIAFGLSAGQLGGAYAPWALALSAVSGSGLPGLFALLGNLGGGWVWFGFQAGLRHMAAAALIYAANTAFAGSKVYTRPAFRPAVAAAMPLTVHFAALIGCGLPQWLLCAAAGVIAALCTHWATVYGAQERSLLLLWGFSVAMTPLTVAGFSPGQTCGAWLTLLLTAFYPPARSAALGALIGLTADLVPARPVLLLALSFGAGSLAASWGARHSRPIAALAFLLCAGAAPVLVSADYWDVLLFQMLVASGAWLCIPRRFLPESAAPHAAPEAVPVAALRQGAAAFRELYDSFFRRAGAEKPENPSVLFDRAAEAVCRNCTLCRRCWQEEYTTTYNAFNDACPALLRRGQAQGADFPTHFSARCIHFAELLRAINMELHAYLLRRQYRLRLQGVRELAAAQYAQMGELLGSTEAVPTAAQTGMTCRTELVLRPRDGEVLCGDQAAVFSVGGATYLLLCDGMGSGEAAHAEASMAVRLVQQFLRAGIEPLSALKTLNAAMRLRSDEGGSFTTIDLLALQRQNGGAALYKYGAAASYLKRGGSVTRFTAQSLPAGLHSLRHAPEVTRLQLTAGSILVMVSDGVIAQGDEWLQNLLAGWEGGDLRALCRQVLTESDRRGGRADDCAVLAMQLEDAPESGRRV